MWVFDRASRSVSIFSIYHVGVAPSGPDPGDSVCSQHEGTGEGGPEDYRGTFRATCAAVRHCPLTLQETLSLAGLQSAHR